VLAFIPSPSTNSLDIGPLSLHLYGLMLAIGVLAAYKISEVRYAQQGRDPADIARMSVVVVVSGVLGARIYHLFTGYKWDQDGIAGAFQIWKGGLSIWGAVLGGLIGVLVMCRVQRLDTFAVMDAIAPGLLIAQAIGRWGNWFNQELFGKPSTAPWALKIDPENRPPGYEQYATFQPTFLYECLWDLGAFAFVLWADRRWKLGHGRVLALYVMAYTAGRAWIEMLRIDTVEYEHVLGMRLNVWTSIVLFCLAAAYFVVVGRTRPGREDEVYTERRLARDRAGEAEEQLVAADAPAPGPNSETDAPTADDGETRKKSAEPPD
jgi:prolipoprotein diacylglyceryl transferase